MRGLLLIIKSASIASLTLYLSVRAADLHYQPAPINNPLRGVVPDNPTRLENFPHSLRYIRIRLADVMIGESEFNWTSLDNKIAEIANEGRQAIVRPFIDWPGSPSALPNFLIQAGVRTNPLPRWRQAHADREILPDYDDPKLQNTIDAFIKAFGHCYDGRPELAFVEAGLLGPWGEWLRWKDSPLSPDVKSRTLAAYANAFHKTKILIRFPSTETERLAFGFHNDWFTGDAGDERRLALAGAQVSTSAWKTSPQGARLFPDFQRKLLISNPEVKIDSAFIAGAEKSHLSYLRIGTSFANVDLFGATVSIRNLAQRLGYEFFVAATQLDFESPNTVSVGVTITNTGSAPFYYAWPAELCLASKAGILSATVTPWDIRTIIPGNPSTQFSARLKSENLASGDYDVLLRIPNPLPTGPSIAFANREQDATVRGWLTLGSVSVR